MYVLVNDSVYAACMQSHNDERRAVIARHDVVYAALSLSLSLCELAAWLGHYIARLTATCHPRRAVHVANCSIYIYI